MSDDVTASINRYESARGAGIEFVFRCHIDERTERCDFPEEVLRQLARVINRHQEKVLPVLLDNLNEFCIGKMSEPEEDPKSKPSTLDNAMLLASYDLKRFIVCPLGSREYWKYPHSTGACYISYRELSTEGKRKWWHSVLKNKKWNGKKTDEPDIVYARLKHELETYIEGFKEEE